MELKRLLLVDDDPDMLDVLREHFEGRYEVMTATSGADAVDRFASQRPDAVFLDITMPGLSGVDVLKLFKQSDARVPVIMVTANAEIAIAEDCLTKAVQPDLHGPHGGVRDRADAAATQVRDHASSFEPSHEAHGLAHRR